jgi:outer membrane protein assembly factor BamB
MMTRWLVCVGLLLLAGCTSTAEEKPQPVSAGPDAPLPPDLGTRKAGSDWPCFLGPTGDSVSSEKGILTRWPADGLPVKRELKLGNGYGMPVISRGRLFHFDRIRDRARLRCFESETFEHLWSFEYPTQYVDKYSYSNGPRCCPVVDGARVYIYGAEGLLHCLRVQDGQEVWKIDTTKEFNVEQNFFGVGSTPVVEGDLLLVVVGGSPPGLPPEDFRELKGNGSGLVAFDKYTGKIRYRVSDELASYTSPVLATIDGRRWCFVFARGGLLGLEPATGKIDFHYPWRARDLESVNAANPVVVGNKVLITETYGPGSALLEVRPGGCKEVWTDLEKGKREKSLMCHWNTPIHVDGYVYGSSGRHTEEASLRCVELATGKVMWSVPGLTRSSLLLVDGHFVCLTEEGAALLIKVNPKRYEEVAKMTLRRNDVQGDPEAANLLHYPCWAAPTLSHGFLYLRGKDRLVCVELIPEKK